MPTLDTARFQDAGKYASYLKTAAGKLRCELAWENLRGFLPVNGSSLQVLDLGGGTGSMSLRLARMGFQVVLLDSSEEMLTIARQEAEVTGVTARIAFRHAGAGQVNELFEPQCFGFVVCHNVLEYVANPSPIVRGIAHVLRNDGVVSLLMRNRAGEVLKAAIKSGDFGLAKANLFAETVVDSLYRKPVRVFDPAEVSHMLAQANLAVIAEYGVRVFSDYLAPEDPVGEAYQKLVELELILGAQPKFGAVARYTQIIAQRPSGTQVSER